MKKKQVFRLLLFFCFFLKTYYTFSNNSLEKKTKNNKSVTLVIFVHGIISIMPHLSFGNFLRFWRDDIYGTVYERAVCLQRQNPFFYQYHPMQNIGLKKIDMNKIEPGSASTAFARIWQTLERHYGNQEHNIYYTYGWSGLLSSRMRNLEAKIFLKELYTKIKQYEAQNIHTKIRLVAYSNGGNMTLTMGKVFEKHKSKYNILEGIELTLIGVPVNNVLEYCLYSSLFEKIYHIYSLGDRVQRLDIFSPGSLLAQRKFRNSPRFVVPEKLIQIDYKIKRPASKYLRKVAEGYCCRLSPRWLRKADPGHSEIWSFGWATRSYRPNFPLYPLPAASIIPILLYAANTDPSFGNDIIIDVRPYQEIVITKSQNKKHKKIIPFITEEHLKTLADDTLQYRPSPWSHELFQGHIGKAREQAEKEWKLKKC